MTGVEVTKPELACPDCGKMLRGRRALSGHLWIVHRKRTGFMADYDHDKLEIDAKLAQLGKRLDGIKVPVVDGKFAGLSHEHSLEAHTHPGFKEIQTILARIERKLDSHTHELIDHWHETPFMGDTKDQRVHIRA